jgi:hypothetical protein
MSFCSAINNAFRIDDLILALSKKRAELGNVPVLRLSDSEFCRPSGLTSVDCVRAEIDTDYAHVAGPFIVLT